MCVLRGQILMNILPTITAYFVIINIYIYIKLSLTKLCNYGNYFLYIVAHTYKYIYKIYIFLLPPTPSFLFWIKIKKNKLEFTFLNHGKINWAVMAGHEVQGILVQEKNTCKFSSFLRNSGCLSSSVPFIICMS